MIKRQKLAHSDQMKKNLEPIDIEFKEVKRQQEK